MALRLFMCLLIDLVWVLPPGSCFNLELREALVFPFPGQQQQQDRNSYFGFALALQKVSASSSAWLMVGAPRANSSAFEPDIKEPGTVFKCSLDDPRRCEELKMDQDYGNTRRKTGDIPYQNNKHGGWVGGAMDAQLPHGSNNQATAVCSPRWTNNDTRYVTTPQMNGVCYWFKNTLPTSPQKMMPLTVPAKQVYDGLYHYYHGQVGFSVQFTSNPSEIILGAPGILNWRGTVVRARDIPASVTRARAFSYFVPNPRYSSQYISAFDLLGYAVTSGKYLNHAELLYGAGAPKGNNGNGKVIIFSYPKNEDSSLLVKQEMVGDQLGANFGASLTSADINGDGLSDLVVGSPMFVQENRPDAGRVVVFLSSMVGGSLEQASTAYYGSSSSGARFGTSLASIGDLNGDGFEDIAVGAPFEGDGAVYIILGSGSELPLTHSQRIGAESFSTGLRGFGIALSRGIDVDDNTYPDVAIGSFISGHAVVVRSRPIARLSSILTPNPSTVSLNDKSFQIGACIQFNGRGTPLQIDIRGTLTLDLEFTRAVFPSGSNILNFTETLTREEQNCKDYTANIRNLRQTPHEPIVLMLDLELIELPRKSLIEQPVADPATIRRVVTRASIATGCDAFGNKTCRTDMRLEADFIDYDFQKKLVIGGDQKASFRVSVLNTDEPAFLPILTVNVEAPLALFLPSSAMCSFPEADNAQRTSLICQLANPIIKEDTVEVELDTNQLSDSLSSVDVNMEVTAQGIEVTPHDTRYSLTLDLAAEASLKLHGYTYEEQIQYHLDQQGNLDSNETLNVQHSYSVVKDGPTPVKQVLLDINIPVRFHDGQTFALVFHPNAVFMGQPVQCQIEGADFAVEISDAETIDSLDNIISPSSGGQRTRRSASLNPEKPTMTDSALNLSCSEGLVECAQLKCRLGPWPSDSNVAEIAVKLSFNFTVLAKYLRTTNMGEFFKTSATATIHSLNNNLSFTGNRTASGVVMTHIQPANLLVPGVAWWIILLAVLGGILLLALLAYGMYKVGFFKRKKLEELKAEKKQALVEQSEDDK